jgi:hypothetical protein
MATAVLLVLVVVLPLALAATDNADAATVQDEMEELLDRARDSDGSEEDYDALVADLDALVDKSAETTGVDKDALEASVLGEMKELLDRAKNSDGSEEDYDAMLGDIDTLVAKGADTIGVDKAALEAKVEREMKGLLGRARDSDGSEEDFDAMLADIDGLTDKGADAAGLDEAAVEAMVKKKIKQVDGRMAQVVDPELREEIEGLLERARKSHESGDGLEALLVIENAIARQDEAIWGTGKGRPSSNPLTRWFSGLNELDRIYFLGVAIALFLTVAAFVFAHGPGEEVVKAPVRYVFKMKRLGIIPLGIVYAVILGVFGILPAVLYGLIGGILGTSFGAPAFVPDLGFIGIVAFPLGFAIAGFILGVVGAVMFDIVAFVTGGIGLEVESGKLKRIGVKSTGKLCASVMFLFGIIGAGVSYAPAPVRAMLPVVVQQVLFVLTMLSIGGVFVGFFMGMLSALAYNILAKLNGGISLELKGGSLRHVGVFSLGSFCAIPLLLIGLVPAALYGPIGTALLHN